MKPKRLGRGLRGLIKSSDPTSLPATRKPQPADATAGQAEGVRELPVADIQPNPFQPRTSFREEDLEDLKASIAEHGVLQPIVVRPSALGYELIAGERRMRAVKSLGREAIPAVVRAAEDHEMQTLALVENLQRVDLNAIEKAKALKAMMRNFGLTQEQAAARVGKARTSISNLVRLLDLPGLIQDMVSEGELSGSQARALLLAEGDERRTALARRAVAKGLSVRQIEDLARRERRVRSGKSTEADPYVRDLEERMSQALGTRAEIKARGQAGTISIRYHDADELDRLLELFGAG